MTAVPAVTIPLDDGALHGDLVVPADALGVVVFAHGSGSGRHSPRNKHVARVLNDRGLATLLIDLLTADEDAVDEETRALRFDIELLALRLQRAAASLLADAVTASLPRAYFGASTGAAAALLAAADQDDGVAAVVSRGGRPDLAGPALHEVRAPTLLIVGGRDPAVLDLNWQALGELRCESDLAIVPDATHLFEEPGALDRVAVLAADWFAHHLRMAR